MFASPRPTPPTTLAVIGCGDVAFSVYLPWLARRPDVRMLGCFDVQRDRAERAATFFGDAATFTDLDDLLALPGLEMIVNLSPAPIHYETNAAALAADLDVYTEKPLAGSLSEARELVGLAHERGRRLLCAPGIMVTPRFRWLSRLIAEGALGRATLITAQLAGLGPAAWREYTGDPAVFYRAGVGPVVDVGIYLLHAATGLFGPARRVQAFGGIAIPERTVLIPDRLGERVTVETNDHMLIGLDFGEAVFAQILASFAVPRSRAPVFELHGSRGSVSIGIEEWYDPSAPVALWRAEERPGGEEAWNAADCPAGDGPLLNILTAGMDHALNVVVGREQPVLTAEHACHVLEVIELAYRSVDEGCALATTTGF